MTEVFTKLGINTPRPIFLAPLAGVSDFPFRLTAEKLGADLTYVEMISACALLHKSSRTWDMLFKHEEEQKLGVQVTGRNAQEVADAVKILAALPFKTVDINMGCPVQKVTKSGCGSAILKDVTRVYETLSRARDVCAKPLSAKIRIGWDHDHINAIEVAQNLEKAGADWITVHGRTRSDDYNAPIKLDVLKNVKESVKIPVIGNGNIFTRQDINTMTQKTNVDGVMVSRGSLGNLWIFSENEDVTLEEWHQKVMQHIQWQSNAYSNSKTSAICMRKHLLWYTKGWPEGRLVREKINGVESLDDAKKIIIDYYESLKTQFSSELKRAKFSSGLQKENPESGHWDPKYEMDRQLDRGVGAEGL